jgi:hypothetical protein
MSNILADYYKGITQQLRGEVDFINSLFVHQGVKGEGNEVILRDLITRFIPRRYGVGTGVVIDHEGNQSGQCDIVIYDTFTYPSVLSLRSVHLFPVDLVYATVEVKTTLDSKSAGEAIKNIASVRNLDIIEEGLTVLNGPTYDDIIVPKPPYGAVFAYNSTVKRSVTFKKWFMPSEIYSAEMLPTLVGCLDQGLVEVWYNSQMKDVRAYTYRLDSQDRDAGGVKIVKRKPVAIDQATILLMFLIRLNDILGYRRLHPSIHFSEHYLSQAAQYRIDI